MIDSDGFFDWAIRDPGPPDRLLSSQPTPVTVYVCHSMVGYYSGPGSYTTMRDPRLHPRAWHWTKSNTDGTVWQHYPIWARLQHGNAANVLGPGGELTGGVDNAPGDDDINEPISASAIAADLRIIADINEWKRSRGELELVRDPSPQPQGAKRGLVEHREMAPQRNTTQCPSERYAPLWAALAQQEDEMTAVELALLLKMASVIAGPEDGSEFPNVHAALDRFTELENDDQREFLGLGQTQRALSDHLERSAEEGHGRLI